jgi:hypothetical protein
MRVHPTVTASTMIAQFDGWHKVRCHKGVVEIFGRCLFPQSHPFAENAKGWASRGLPG